MYRRKLLDDWLRASKRERNSQHCKINEELLHVSRNNTRFKTNAEEQYSH